MGEGEYVRLDPLVNKISGWERSWHAGVEERGDNRCWHEFESGRCHVTGRGRPASLRCRFRRPVVPVLLLRWRPRSSWPLPAAAALGPSLQCCQCCSAFSRWFNRVMDKIGCNIKIVTQVSRSSRVTHEWVRERRERWSRGWWGARISGRRRRRRRRRRMGSCGWLGWLCGVGRRSLTCYLCLGEHKFFFKLSISLSATYVSVNINCFLLFSLSATCVLVIINFFFILLHFPSKL